MERGEHDAGERRGDMRERRLLLKRDDVGLGGGDVRLVGGDGGLIGGGLRLLLVGILLGDDALLLQRLPALVGDGGELCVGLRLQELRLGLGEGGLGLQEALQGLRIFDLGQQLALADVVADVDVARLDIAGGAGEDGRLLEGLDGGRQLDPRGSIATVQPGGEHDGRTGGSDGSGLEVVAMAQLGHKRGEADDDEQKEEGRGGDIGRAAWSRLDGGLRHKSFTSVSRF